MKIAPIKMKNSFRKIFSGQDRKPRVDKRDLEFVRNWIANAVIVELSEALRGWVYLHRFDSVKKAINNCRDHLCESTNFIKICANMLFVP